jgi:methionyl-tRNA formyltransferase
MRLILLTSDRQGIASLALPRLLEAAGLEVARLILCEGQVADPWRNRRRKLEKTLRIGLLGALNGVRMRRWYRENVQRILAIEDLETVARRHQISLERTPTINCARTRELFADARAELGISLGNAFIGRRVFSIPRLGMINIHHELLPGYRGAQGVIWQLYEGSRETGYTIHQIDQHIDTGAILHQERLPIRFRSSLEETVSETYARVYEASVGGLVHTLQHLDALRAAARPQGPGRSYTTPSFGQFLRILREHRRLAAGAA